jgi:hypothetical protein
MTNISAQTELHTLLPEKVNDWKASKDLQFTPESLYDYINGGAELYISYNFKNVLSRTYKNSNDEEIQVEIFDMQKPENAYGVFSQQREEETNKFGQGSQVVLGSIIFWKDNYFVSMMNHNETPQVKQGMLSIASAIDDNILQTGQKPEIIDYLSEQDLDASAIRFFKHYIWLNSYYYIADSNYFNIDEHVDAVLAKYNLGNPRPIALIIEYPGNKEAQVAWENVLQEIKALKKTEKYIMFEMQEGTLSGIKKHQNLVTGIFNASTEKFIHRLLDDILTKANR